MKKIAWSATVGKSLSTKL